MLGSKPLDSPMEQGVKLVADGEEILNYFERYRRLVDKLNYLIVTRLDIAFLVSVVSQFLSSPHTSHWDAVIQILRYLNKAPGK